MSNYNHFLSLHINFSLLITVLVEILLQLNEKKTS